eukprot:10982335-Heterocapsa_arctica.AAC.1
MAMPLDPAHDLIHEVKYVAPLPRMAPGVGKVACPAGTFRRRSSSSPRRGNDAAPSGDSRVSIACAPKT